MDTQTMKDYIEDLLIERDELFSRLRLLEQTLTDLERQMEVLKEALEITNE